MLASPRIAQSTWSALPAPARLPEGWASVECPGDVPAPRGSAVMAEAPARDLVSLMYEQHHAELYRAAMRACRSPETAEDLVQEAFLRLVREIAADRTPDNVRAWLHRVIANLAVSLGRRAAIGQRFADALVRHDEPVTPEAVVMDVERRSELASALRVLPDEARTALVLAASGFSGAEIAAVIGRSDCATRALMCRARLKLRDRLAEAEFGRRADEARVPDARAGARGASATRPRGPAERAMAARAAEPIGVLPTATALPAL